MNDEVLARRRKQLEEQQNGGSEPTSVQRRSVGTMEEILAGSRSNLPSGDVGLSNDQVLQLINRGPELVGLYNQILRQAAIKNPLAQNSLDSLNSVLEESGYDTEEIAVMKFIYAYELAYGQLGPVEIEPKGWLQRIYWNKRRLAEIQADEKVELARIETEAELERERINHDVRVEAEARALVLDKGLEVQRIQAEADREKYKVERLQLEQDKEKERKDGERRSKFKGDLIAHLISLENSVWLKHYVQACRDLEYAVPEDALKEYISALFDENDNIDFLPIHKKGKDQPYNDNYNNFLTEVCPILKTKRDNVERAMDRVFMKVHDYMYNQLKDKDVDVSDITIEQYEKAIGQCVELDELVMVMEIGSELDTVLSQKIQAKIDFEKEAKNDVNYKTLASKVGEKIRGQIGSRFCYNTDITNDEEMFGVFLNGLKEVYNTSRDTYEEGDWIIVTKDIEISKRHLTIGGKYQIKRIIDYNNSSRNNALFVNHNGNSILIPGDKNSYAKSGDKIQQRFLQSIKRPHDEEQDYVGGLVKRIRAELTQGSSQSETAFEKKVNKYHPNLNHEVIANQRVRDEMIKRFKALYGVEKGE